MTPAQRRLLERLGLRPEVGELDACDGQAAVDQAILDRVAATEHAVGALEKALDAMAPGWRDADELVRLVHEAALQGRTPGRHG